MDSRSGNFRPWACSSTTETFKQASCRVANPLVGNIHITLQGLMHPMEQIMGTGTVATIAPVAIPCHMKSGYDLSARLPDIIFNPKNLTNVSCTKKINPSRKGMPNSYSKIRPERHQCRPSPTIHGNKKFWRYCLY